MGAPRDSHSCSGQVCELGPTRLASARRSGTPPSLPPVCRVVSRAELAAAGKPRVTFVVLARSPWKEEGEDAVFEDTCRGQIKCS